MSTGTDVTSRPPLSLGRALALPLFFIAALGSYCLLDSIRANPVLLRTFLVVCGLLLAWAVVLFATARAKGRRLSLQITLSKQHYVQACVHSSIFLYWGWYWREGVYQYAYLIVAQLLFAFAVDILLGWSRRDTYTLGFGPFPVVLSTNLFLWFKLDWFYWQFFTVALGMAAKELIRWNKEGRSAHIFNPSSFPLAIVSLGLILTHNTDLTWGVQIATSQFFPPHMYLFLFLVSLPGQYFFGVTSMTLSAVVTTYGFGLAYFAATGTYFFSDSYIPIAVFLGMNLLFTDPSTSPRTDLGRVFFGMLYGASVVVLVVILDAVGAPAFYDKLLAVPLLNLSIRAIDRAARSKALRWLDPARLAPALTGRRRNLAYMAVWALVFSGMSLAQGVGDDHRGLFLPFWQQACRENRKGACTYLTYTEITDCQGRSGWACNEVGLQKLASDPPAAFNYMSLGCVFGFQPACTNVEILKSGSASPMHAPPSLDDFRILLIAGKSVPLRDWSPADLYARACFQGWPDTCGPR